MLMNGEKKEGEWENGKRIRWINEWYFINYSYTLNEQKSTFFNSLTSLRNIRFWWKTTKKHASIGWWNM